ncbi:MAG: hypothetical protein LC800_04020, partial [Acidobacteria bacterium]|nr:hypothetical protein [Acidobacteriota bacterium]
MSHEHSPGEEARGEREDSRLERIERAVAQISARLKAVELQLAATRGTTAATPPAQPFGQGSQRPPTRADSETRAAEARGAKAFEVAGEKGGGESPY